MKDNSNNEINNSNNENDINNISSELNNSNNENDINNELNNSKIDESLNNNINLETDSNKTDTDENQTINEKIPNKVENDIKAKMKRNRILIVIMFVIGIAGIIMISYNFIISKVHLTFESVNLELFGNSEPKVVNRQQPTPEETPEAEVPKPDPVKTTGEYIAYLEIPKINLKQGFHEIDNPNNHVDKGIQTINPSDFPDVNKGNLILAAHSGTASISYFKHLYQLSKNDEIYVYYNGYKYIYKIVNIYNVEKNGKVAIYRDNNKTTITLITCTKDSDTLQTVYIGELISKEGI